MMAAASARAARLPTATTPAARLGRTSVDGPRAAVQKDRNRPSPGHARPHRHGGCEAVLVPAQCVAARAERPDDSAHGGRGLDELVGCGGDRVRVDPYPLGSNRMTGSPGRRGRSESHSGRRGAGRRGCRRRGRHSLRAAPGSQKRRAGGSRARPWVPSSAPMPSRARREPRRRRRAMHIAGRGERARMTTDPLSSLDRAPGRGARLRGRDEGRRAEREPGGEGAPGTALRRVRRPEGRRLADDGIADPQHRPNDSGTCAQQEPEDERPAGETEEQSQYLSGAEGRGDELAVRDAVLEGLLEVDPCEPGYGEIGDVEAGRSAPDRRREVGSGRPLRLALNANASATASPAIAPSESTATTSVYQPR